MEARKYTHIRTHWLEKNKKTNMLKARWFWKQDVYSVWLFIIIELNNWTFAENTLAGKNAGSFIPTFSEQWTMYIMFYNVLTVVEYTSIIYLLLIIQYFLSWKYEKYFAYSSNLTLDDNSSL